MAADKRNQKRVKQLCLSASDVHMALRERYGLNHTDLIEKDIRNAYLDGLHAEVSEQVLKYLEMKHGSQVRVASIFGVDRSTISKMKQNRSVPARYLEFVAANGFALERESAHRNGLIEASFYVRTKVIKDTSCTSRMTEAEFTELACGQHTEWYEAFILTLMEVEDFIQ